jgi:hypothetical protein
MGILLNFQFLVIFNLLIVMIWPATSPYMGARTAEAGRWSGMSPLYIILAILTALAVILDIVFLAGGHAH